MKKNIIALTVLMALSATAQAEPMDQDYTLNISGEVVLDGCAFEGSAATGNDLNLTLEQYSLAKVIKNPERVLASIGDNKEITLVCPPGITSLDYAIKPNPGSYDNDMLTNTRGPGLGGAEGVGFKVKAAFDSELSENPWMVFDNPPNENIAIKDGKVSVAFGANYALVKDRADTKPGLVEAQLPFTIIYN